MYGFDDVLGIVSDYRDSQKPNPSNDSNSDNSLPLKAMESSLPKGNAEVNIAEGGAYADNSITLGSIGQIGNSVTGFNGEDVNNILANTGSLFSNTILGVINQLTGSNDNNIARLIDSNKSIIQSNVAGTTDKSPILNKSIFIAGAIIGGAYYLVKKKII